MGTLDEAYAWYRAARKLTEAMDRLGRNYWAGLPWDGALGHDNILRHLEATEIGEMSRTVLENLDDLAVMFLFSAFEGIVRDRALEQIRAELRTTRHPALKQLVKDLNDTIGQGSFYRVLEAYKESGADLLEEVNQVRKYRNWVAHGRRTEQPANVTPAVAFDRLNRFLDMLMGLSAPLA